MLIIFFRIENMLRAIGRIIRARQEIRMRENSTIEIPFDIFKDARYLAVKDVDTVTVKRSFRRGLRAAISKSDILTKEEEALVLASDGASLNHPRGLNNRFLYFCCRNLFIRSQQELRDTNAAQFELRVDENGIEFFRYVFFLFIEIINISSSNLSNPIDHD